MLFLSFEVCALTHSANGAVPRTKTRRQMLRLLSSLCAREEGLTQRSMKPIYVLNAEPHLIHCHKLILRQPCKLPLYLSALDCSSFGSTMFL